MRCASASGVVHGCMWIGKRARPWPPSSTEPSVWPSRLELQSPNVRVEGSNPSPDTFYWFWASRNPAHRTVQCDHPYPAAPAWPSGLARCFGNDARKVPGSNPGPALGTNTPSEVDRGRR